MFQEISIYKQLHRSVALKIFRTKENGKAFVKSWNILRIWTTVYHENNQNRFRRYNRMEILFEITVIRIIYIVSQ